VTPPVLWILRYAEPITRDSARDEARRELAKDAYRAHEPSALERLVEWVLERLGDLLDRASAASPGGGAGLLAIVAVLVLIVVAVLVRFGPLSRSASRTAEEFDLGPGGTTPEEHRALADRFAAGGRYAEAVRERLRAVVRDLERRGVVEPRPGRTVSEIVAETRRTLPDAAAGLARGGRVFSEIWYGGRKATPADDAVLREVERRVAAAERRDADADADAEPTWAVPGAAP
jgi:hypothetical protein